MTTKRERVTAALRGEPVDRVPVSFWLHNFATENSAEGLAGETLRLARTFDWDFLKPQSRAQCFAESWGFEYTASRDRAVTRLTKDVLPCTWVAFLVAACTGALLFASKAVTYGHNFFFLGKMVLLLLAGTNMAIFHLMVGRDIERWGATPHTTPLPAKIAGAVSLCLWIAVVTFGRWIGFTLHPILGAS